MTGDIVKPLLYGMVHLPPLPGSPGYTGNMKLDEIIEYACDEAYKLYSAGYDGFIVENYMDYPFNTVNPSFIQIKSLEEIISNLAEKFKGKMKIGLNILRNAGIEAARIACIYGLDFIRVNAYLEPVWAPEGLLHPIAGEIWKILKSEKCRIEIYADVNVKHSKPILSFIEAVRNVVSRGRINGLIISGIETGSETPVSYVYVAKMIGGDRVKILVGSGVDEENIGSYIGLADALIVGTSIKKDGVTVNPIDRDKAKRLILARDRVFERIRRFTDKY